MKPNPYANNLVVDCYFLEGFYPHFGEVGKLPTHGNYFFLSSEDKEYLEQKSYDLNLLSPKLYVRYDSGREDKIELNMTPKVAKEKLYKVRELLTELVNLGESYAYFQSAKSTHKNLKKSLKSLTNIS